MVLFVIAGAILTACLPINLIELLMSVTVVLPACIMVFSERITKLPQITNLQLTRVISGFIAGLVGTGGAIRGLTLIALHLGKSVFVATSALIDLGVDVSRAVVYTAHGFFTTEQLF